jgi:hypothetical protein
MLKKKKVTGRPVKYRKMDSASNLKVAMKEVLDRRMSYGQAAVEYGAPRPH